MYRLKLKPKFDAYKRKNPRLSLFFDELPTMKAMLYAVDEELDGSKDDLFRKNCKKLVMDIGVPRMPPDSRSNTVCSGSGILSLEKLRVYKAT